MMSIGYAASGTTPQTATNNRPANVPAANNPAAIRPTSRPLPTATPIRPKSFRGSAADVLGPEIFVAGTYRVTVETDGFVSVTLNPLEGACYQGDSNFIQMPLFALMSGQANDGASTVMTSEGCKTLIEVSNVQSSWTLTFEYVG